MAGPEHTHLTLFLAGCGGSHDFQAIEQLWRRGGDTLWRTDRGPIIKEGGC